MNGCPRCAHDTLTEDGLCEQCNLPIAKDAHLPPRPFHIIPTPVPVPVEQPLAGRLFLYEWPNGEETVVLALDQTDDDGNVGIALLSENQRVSPSTIRPFTETEET